MNEYQLYSLQEMAGQVRYARNLRRSGMVREAAEYLRNNGWALEMALDILVYKV